MFGPLLIMFLSCFIHPFLFTVIAQVHPHASLVIGFKSRKPLISSDAEVNGVYTELSGIYYFKDLIILLLFYKYNFSFSLIIMQIRRLKVFNYLYFSLFAPKKCQFNNDTQSLFDLMPTLYFQ